jgi:uncharacterized protein
MKRRRLVPVVALVATVSLLRAQTSAPTPPLPIIDMHLHALEADAQAPPPLGMCPGAVVGIAVMAPRRAWADTFMERSKKPACSNPIWPPKTATELSDRTLAVMKRRNVYGVTNNAARFLRLTDQELVAHHCR